MHKTKVSKKAQIFSVPAYIDLKVGNFYADFGDEWYRRTMNGEVRLLLYNEPWIRG